MRQRARALRPTAVSVFAHDQFDGRHGMRNQRAAPEVHPDLRLLIRRLRIDAALLDGVTSKTMLIELTNGDHERRQTLEQLWISEELKTSATHLIAERATNEVTCPISYWHRALIGPNDLDEDRKVVEVAAGWMVQVIHRVTHTGNGRAAVADCGGYRSDP